MWLSAIKLAMNAGSHIYKKKQETKMMMANAQAKHAEKMASGELEYSGKLLEARQTDYKDEAILIILTLPILVLAYGVFSDDPAASAKIQEFFQQFQQLLLLFYALPQNVEYDLLSSFLSSFKYLCSFYTINTCHDKNP